MQIRRSLLLPKDCATSLKSFLKSQCSHCCAAPSATNTPRRGAFRGHNCKRYVSFSSPLRRCRKSKHVSCSASRSERKSPPSHGKSYKAESPSPDPASSLSMPTPLHRARVLVLSISMVHSLHTFTVTHQSLVSYFTHTSSYWAHRDLVCRQTLSTLSTFSSSEVTSTISLLTYVCEVNNIPMSHSEVTSMRSNLKCPTPPAAPKTS